MSFVSIVAFIIVFGLIVSVHEWGHLIAAKKMGVVVYEFSIGMGPKIFSFTKNGTSYVLRILPIGGFVSMAGDTNSDGIEELRAGRQVKLSFDDQDEVGTIDLTEKPANSKETLMTIQTVDLNDKMEITGSDNNGDTHTYKISDKAKIILSSNNTILVAPKNKRLSNLPNWKQIIINAAGPFMNFVLAAILFFGIGLFAPSVPDDSSTVGTVNKAYPAYQAGIKKGDVITKINQQKISKWSEISTALNSNKKNVEITYKHKGTSKTVSVELKKVDGNYMLGISQNSTTKLNDRISYGGRAFIDGATSIWKALGNLIIHPSLNQLGGPVAIAKATNQATNGGIWALASLTAFLSLNIGTFNLIPIPVLDGGKILINIIQAITRRKLSQKANGIITTIGVVFVLVILVAVTINDILR